MENVNNHVIEKLNLLIAVAEKGKTMYKNASVKMEDKVMKEAFKKMAKTKTSHVTELKAVVKSLGHKAVTVIDALSNSHNKRPGTDPFFLSASKEAIDKACLTLEEETLNAYTKALSSNYIFGSIKELLNQQVEAIRANLEIIKEDAPVPALELNEQEA